MSASEGGHAGAGNGGPARERGPWRYRVDGYDLELARVQDAHLSLAGGGLGTSGAPLLAQGSPHSWLVASGVYDGEGPETTLLVGPVPTNLAVTVADDRLHRELDLYRGVLREVVEDAYGRIELVRFVSLARPGVLGARTRCPPDVGLAEGRLIAGRGADDGEHAGRPWTRVSGTHGGRAPTGGSWRPSRSFAPTGRATT